MKRMLAVCVMLAGVCLALSPVHARGASFQVLDLPGAQAMILFAGQDAEGAPVSVAGCGDFSLVTLVDYSEGAERSVALPWNHKAMSADKWSRMAAGFEKAMAAQCAGAGSSSVCSVNAASASALSNACAEKEAGKVMRKIKASSGAKERTCKWWPPTCPEEDPF